MQKVTPQTSLPENKHPGNLPIKVENVREIHKNMET